MKLLILLGEDRRYLTCMAFSSETALDRFIDKIHPLMMANVKGEQPLKKRLELVKDNYFPYAGAVFDFIVVDVDDITPFDHLT